MAITVGDDSRIYQNGVSLKFLRDAEYDAAPLLSGVTAAGDIVLGSFTSDGFLNVNANITIPPITIGNVGVLLQVGNHTQLWDGVLNPDNTTYSGFMQDPRMSFTGSSLNVEVLNPPDLSQIETDLANIFDAARGLSPIQTTITRDANDNVVQIVASDGLITKTSTFTYNAAQEVVSIAEVTV